VRYDDFAQIEAIVNDIRTLLIEHPEIDDNQTLIVNFNAFAASSLDIMIYTFTHTTNWVKYHAVKQDVLIAIGRVVERHGAEIAFPTQTLHLSQPLVGPPDEALAKA
jgi:MscS family membrane protein